MPDIELVIKIPKESYEFAKECKSKGSSKYNWNLTFDNIVFMIANGTPLPKGHDRLIEAREVINAMFVGKTIDDVPTIIEADKEE